MSIRALIEKDNPVTTDTLESNGQTFIFKGNLTGTALAEALLMPLERRELLARHYTQMTGTVVNADTVRHIRMVHATLQPQEGETAYDETEIASLSAKQGALFLLMMGKAYGVCGINDVNSVPEGASVMDIVTSKNSSPEKEDST